MIINQTFRKTLLVNKTGIYLIKRDMGIKGLNLLLLQKGTILTGAEKESLSAIFNIKKTFLKNGPLTDENMISMAQIMVSIDPKLTQHVLTASFPTYTVPLRILEKKLPGLEFSKNAHTNANWDQLLSALAIYHHKDKPIFSQGKIISLGSQGGSLPDRTSQQYKNTNQMEPDYLYTLNKDNNIWSRFYDWKTGKISSNSGHIFGTSSEALYEALSENLLAKSRIISSFKRYF